MGCDRDHFRESCRLRGSPLERGVAPPVRPFWRVIGIVAGAASVLILWNILSAIGTVSVHSDPVQKAYSILKMAIILFWLTGCILLIFRRAGMYADGP
ncbi:MAG: hypothetical protein METHP_01732 [Methanoregula sp. SKADARSKE-2]|nr:MAG: hypothetical protein METHP_01732 [Methanoregula sp. SKADARSKE-2]